MSPSNRAARVPVVLNKNVDYVMYEFGAAFIHHFNPFGRTFMKVYAQK